MRHLIGTVLVTKLKVGVPRQMRWDGLVWASLVVVISGCAQPVSIQSRFNPDEVAWSRQSGTASLHGQAFLRTRGGEVRTCAGQKTSLIPASAYSRETHEFVLRTMGRVPILNPDSLAPTYARETRCDAQGNFAFRNLPAGDWFVRSIVMWEVPMGNYVTSTEGGVMSQPVTTHPGDTAEVIVSR